MASILPTGGTCEKYERGFCSSARYEQKPLSVFKNPSPFSQNPSSEVDWLKLEKNGGFEFFGGGRFWRESGFRTPPEVVSGIGRGGGGPISPGGDKCPSQYHLSDPPCADVT
jgi:hypothetical protein